jgi:hypothetical protein
MRVTEFIADTEAINEIERLPAYQYQGGKSYLGDKEYGKTVKKLPGGSGFLYSIGDSRWGSGVEVKLWDPNGKEFINLQARPPEPKPVKKNREAMWKFRDRFQAWENIQKGLIAPGQLIGQLSLHAESDFPIRGALQVGTITVDEEYRGMSLAKALYGIVLTVMKRPVLAGSSQTPGGRRNWVSLANIPGVQMKGYFSIAEVEISGKSRYGNTEKAEKNIDIIMGQLGGQYLGSKRDSHYFAFDVKPNTTGEELEAAIGTKLNRVYSGSWTSTAGLYAVWTGQAE